MDLRPHGASGVLLLSILVSVGFQMASPAGDWALAMTIVLQGGTLLVALWAWPPPRLVAHSLRLALVGLVAVAAGIFIVSGTIDPEVARIASLLLAAAAPVLIARGVVRDVRAEGAITVRTMFGVLSVYLLLGTIFGYLFGAVGNFESAPFFAEQASADGSDYLYFSFTTMTTTGYGDLTAATDFGRSLAITEALIGQIYLVTVVAVIVANLGRRRA